MAIAAEGFFVFRFFAVQLGTGEQHRANAMHVRAVRVFGLLALGVVLAVNGSPLFGHLTGGHPQPKAEKNAMQWGANPRHGVPGGGARKWSRWQS